LKNTIFLEKYLVLLKILLGIIFLDIEIGSALSWVGSVEGYRWVGKISFGVKKQAWEADARDKHGKQ
jgi:hypothetical protein